MLCSVRHGAGCGIHYGSNGIGHGPFQPGHISQHGPAWTAAAATTTAPPPFTTAIGVYRATCGPNEGHTQFLSNWTRVSYSVSL